jgi:hypothetical protein
MNEEKSKALEHGGLTPLYVFFIAQWVIRFKLDLLNERQSCIQQLSFGIGSTKAASSPEPYTHLGISDPHD